MHASFFASLGAELGMILNVWFSCFGPYVTDLTLYRTTLRVSRLKVDSSMVTSAYAGFARHPVCLFRGRKGMDSNDIVNAIVHWVHLPTRHTDPSTVCFKWMTRCFFFFFRYHITHEAFHAIKVGVHKKQFSKVPYH